MHRRSPGSGKTQQYAALPYPWYLSGCFGARSLVRSERPAHNRAVVGSNPSGPTDFEPLLMKRGDKRGQRGKTTRRLPYPSIEKR